MLNCEIKYLDADINESVPYIIKYPADSQPQKLIGFPEREKLYRFLEINDERAKELYPTAVKKNRKLFKTN